MNWYLVDRKHYFFPPLKAHKNQRQNKNRSYNDSSRKAAHILRFNLSPCNRQIRITNLHCFKILEILQCALHLYTVSRKRIHSISNTIVIKGKAATRVYSHDGHLGISKTVHIK